MNVPEALLVALQQRRMIDVFCLGCPSIPGDAIGPLVGSELLRHSFDADIRVIGTMRDPITEATYRIMLNRLRKNSFVLVIDAAVGAPLHAIVTGNTPIKPGAVYEEITFKSSKRPIGDAHIKAFTGTTLAELCACDRSTASFISATISAALIDQFLPKKEVYI